MQLMTHSCKTVVNHMIPGENTEKLCQVTDLLKSENVEVQFCCCTHGVFLVVVSGGYIPVVADKLVIGVTSLVAEHRL